MREKLFPFGWSNITKLAISYFFATLYFYIPVYSLYLQGRGLNFVQINSLWGVIVGTMFLAEVPTGMLADWVGRKRSVNIALGLQLVGELIFIFARDYWSFALAALIGGLGFAFSSGSLDALVYDSLKLQRREGDMTQAMGFIQAAKRLANLFAFAVGGLLAIQLTQERFSLAIIVTAVAVAIGFLISLTVREPPDSAQQQHEGSTLGLLGDGIQLLQRNRPFRRLALLMLATIPFVDYLLNLYQPRFVAVGVPSVWLGLALSLASALSILGARYAYRLEERLGAKKSLWLAVTLPGFLYLLIAAIKFPILLVPTFCLLYGSTSLRDPIFAGRLNPHIESRNRATVLSLISMISGIYVALMGLVIGRLADYSLTYAFIFMGIIILIGSVLFHSDE